MTLKAKNIIRTAIFSSHVAVCFTGGCDVPEGFEETDDEAIEADDIEADEAEADVDIEIAIEAKVAATSDFADADFAFTVVELDSDYPEGVEDELAEPATGGRDKNVEIPAKITCIKMPDGKFGILNVDWQSSSAPVKPCPRK